MIIAKDYHIEMLSVGAADAFILYVIDNQDKGHLILIDAGNYNDGDKIIKHIRKYYSNPVIDLAIVTHCDDDHYGGFVRMLEKLKKGERDAIGIGQFWVNDTGKNHIYVDDVDREVRAEVREDASASLQAGEPSVEEEVGGGRAEDEAVEDVRHGDEAGDHAYCHGYGYAHDAPSEDFEMSPERHFLPVFIYGGIFSPCRRLLHGGHLFPVDVLFDVLHSVLEASDAFAYPAHELGNLCSSEYQKDYEGDDEHFTSAEV